jgi:SAM-dependent methyltransferase
MPGLSALINEGLRRTIGREVRRYRQIAPTAYSKERRTWRYTSDGRWIGGLFPAPNFSHGYHAILQQWWEGYTSPQQPARVLLVSENNKVKKVFEARYPNWSFVTLDKFDNLGEPIDVNADLCAGVPEGFTRAFDLIICQATLEHVYAPFASVVNMLAMLKPGGILVLHTHTPEYPYHPCPRDYIRFQLDWFQDVPVWRPGCELLELYAEAGNVFAAYRLL